MKVIETGHIYELRSRRPENAVGPAGDPPVVTFINKQPGQEHDGTTTQEVLRMLIDRTRHCANCMPHRNNEQIVYHLRMALVLHEARALERKVEKGDIIPEYLGVGSDGHFKLDFSGYGEHRPLDTPHLIPHRNDWDRVCNHPAAPEEEEKQNA